MNPERMAMNAIDRGREKRTELSPILQQGYEKAEREVLSNPDYVIQESEFLGEGSVFDPATIASDIETGNRLHSQFEQRMTSQDRNTKKIADTFESVILMQSEMGNWLGDATTLKTSRYDDYINKIDMISEWHTPETGSQVLALGVDVTFGTSSIEKKIAAIKEEIDRGKLGSIRYFKDSRGDFMGVRNNVPRTIVGVSQPVVEELAGLWINKQNKMLGIHPIQRVLTSQMLRQTQAMYAYADKRGNHQAMAAYQQSLGILKRVREGQPQLDTSKLIEDPVWKEITAQTQKQFKV